MPIYIKYPKEIKNIRKAPYDEFNDGNDEFEEDLDKDKDE